MTSPSKDLGEILHQAGIATLGKNLFYNKMPENTEPSVALVDAGALFSNPKWKRDELFIQFLIRGVQNDYDDTYNLAYSIRDYLLGRDPVTINGSLYSLFVLEGGINNIGEDSSGRTRLSMRFRIVRENYTLDSRLEF